jgi:superfamily II DNA or RNA helicase
MLSDLELAAGYSTGTADLVGDFYVPCLDEACRYDRAVGYFRSSLFILIGVAFSNYARRGGVIRLVCSPSLDPEDAKAVERGLSWRETLDLRIRAEIQSLLDDPASHSAAEFLATLVATRVMEIRLAFRPGSVGIFHDKVGIFEDVSGNKVSFVGSANETYAAWDPDTNHEGFEVFCSWSGTSDAERVRRHVQYFDRLWAGQEPGVTILDFPEASKAKLLQLTNPEGVDAAAEKLREVVTSRRPLQVSRSGQGRKTLQPHQRLAVENWFAGGQRGILKHATGAGKTVTAIDIMRRWVMTGKPAIVFVPTQVLASQWRSEIRSELGDEAVGILDAGAGFGRARWEEALADYTRPMAALGPRIVIATMQTGSTPAFLARVKAGEHLLVIADEVHRIGSPQQRSILGIDAGGRLALSATPERYGDPEGTSKILHYFGPVLEPEFTIGDAIAAGRLVPYDYFVHRVNLIGEEEQRWEELSDQIRREYAQLPKDSAGDRTYTDRYLLLLINRARILKQAANKVEVAKRVLTQEYKDGDRWLVYCDDRAQLRKVADSCRAQGLSTYEYHSAMEGSTRETLVSFQMRGGVLVAIRCLDEGVDLPALNRALIVASSSNPREFIQRRGRVLRSAPGKYSAAVHDLLVVPARSSEESADTMRHSILRTELSRARQFATYSRNTATKTELDILTAEGMAPLVAAEENYEEEDSGDVRAED